MLVITRQYPWRDTAFLFVSISHGVALRWCDPTRQQLKKLSRHRRRRTRKWRIYRPSYWVSINVQCRMWTVRYVCFSYGNRVFVYVYVCLVWISKIAAIMIHICVIYSKKYQFFYIQMGILAREIFINKRDYSRQSDWNKTVKRIIVPFFFVSCRWR